MDDDALMIRALVLYAPFAVMWLGSSWLQYLLSLLGGLTVFGLYMTFRTAPCYGMCTGGLIEVALLGFAILLFVGAVVGKALNLLRP